MSGGYLSENDSSQIEQPRARGRHYCAHSRGAGLVAIRSRSMHFLLIYEFVPDYLEHRPLHRSEHLRFAWEAHRRGELVIAGALADPVDGAVLFFQGESDQAARAFAESDPYVKAGLVKRWSVRPWTTVVGETAATPVRPPS
jgi:uncharacterized protein YciI